MLTEKEMRLFKRPSTREGFEQYTDLFLVWKYNDKFYHIRVKPQFNNEYRILLARAIEVPSDEPFEKYW